MEEVSHHHTISMIHSFTFPVLLIVLKRPCNSGLFCQEEKLLSEFFRVLILALKYFLALNNDILRKNVCLKSNFAENCMKMKEFGPRRRPWRPLGSATVDHLLCSNEIDILGKWEKILQ